MGRDKNGMGNRGLRELICTIHGHELREGNAGGKGGEGRRKIKGRKEMKQLQ